MDRIIDFTDYVSGQHIVEDLGSPLVQTALLALFVVTILMKWKVIFTFLLMASLTILVIRVGFGGGASGVLEQAPVFLSGLGLVIAIAVYLFYVRR